MNQRNIYQSKAVWIAALAVFLTTFLVYLPALQNGFVNWDDNILVYENNYLKPLGFQFMWWAMTDISTGLWHPMLWLSLSLDYTVWGLNPKGYHLTNIVLHAVNTFLVFILAARLLEHSNYNKAKLNKKAIITGAVTALLFGLHPLHVESVAWVTERKDVLYSFFFLSSILGYLRYASADSKKFNYYALSLFLFVLALMSKPMAVTLPVILLILDYYPLKRLKSGEPGNVKWMLIEKLPFFLLSMLAALLTIWVHSTAGELKTLGRHPFDVRLFVAVWAYIFYLVKLVLPINLAPFYPHPGEINLFTFRYIGSCIFLLILTFLAIRSFKKDRAFSAIWVYYFVALIPVIGIVQAGGYSVADRFTYLPSLGFFLLAGLGMASIFGRCSKKQYFTLTAIVFVVLAILTIKTNHQISIWRNSFTLWSHEIRLYPDVAGAYSNRGNAYRVTGDYKKAILDTSKAIELDSQYSYAYTERGIAYYLSGEYTKALNDLNRSIDIGRSYADTYNGRGIVYSVLGDYQSAVRDFTKAIELRPKYAEAYYNRGNAYYNLGNYQQAVMDFSMAIEITPQNADAYYNRGMVYQQGGRYQEAAMDYIKAAALGLKEAQDDLSLLQKANPGLRGEGFAY